MNKLICSLILPIFSVGFPVNAQNHYIPVPEEHYTHYYERCEGISMPVPKNMPWYVFSDRDNNPVFQDARSKNILKNVDLGTSFLVIGRSEKRLQLIEAEKVICTMSSGTWNYRTGYKEADVIKGWMDKDKLLLSNKCLKVCDIGLLHAPLGIYNLKGFLMFNRVSENENHNFFAQFPGNYRSDTHKSPAGETLLFGYIYKTIRMDNTDWYLVGEKSEIKMGDRQKILVGWKPQEQIEFWKHRLALEYDWEHVQSRVSKGVRLIIAKDPHSANLPESDYTRLIFAGKEYNYTKSYANKNYYYQRELGTGFRNIILKEDSNNIKVAMLKNSCNVHENIVSPARAIANKIGKEMLKPKVVFVLDGTGSLRFQLENILKTIRTTAFEIIKTNTGTAIDYEFFATIYRDKYYNNYIFERMEHFAGIDAVCSWISNNLTAVDNNAGGCFQPNALFYGLKKTFDCINAFESRSFFNPVLYVVIGACGSHDRPDETYVPISVIKDYLKCNLSDLAAIQVSHSTRKTSNGVPDYGKPFDMFQTQFKDIRRMFGNPETENIPEGTLEMFPEHPGSLLAYPQKNSAFSDTALSFVIEKVLSDFNANLKEKIIRSALDLRSRNSECPEIKREFQVFIEDFYRQYNLELYNIDDLLKWSIRFIINNGFPYGTKTDINSEYIADCFNFFNPGYVSMKYNFLDHTPFKYVIYMTNTEVDKLSEFVYRISTIRGNPRIESQKKWHYILTSALNICQTTEQVNQLTISDATSILTGYKGSPKYDHIKIGDITSRIVFPDQLLMEYIFEWSITFGYLQSIKSGSWKLEPKNLRSNLALINAILKLQKKPAITESQLKRLSENLVRKDIRPVNDYFKGYPGMDVDILYKIKTYWVDADFFSHEGNDFTEILLNSCK